MHIYTDRVCLGTTTTTTAIIVIIIIQKVKVGNGKSACTATAEHDCCIGDGTIALEDVLYLKVCIGIYHNVCTTKYDVSIYYIGTREFCSARRARMRLKSAHISKPTLRHHKMYIILILYNNNIHVKF